MHRPSGHDDSRPPPPGEAGQRRERNAAATQKRLLDAAEHEFATRGFSGARLREIAVAAGVQPALIHHYFTDKHGLYRAVLDRAMLPQSTESWGLLATGPNLEELVRGFVEMLVPFYAQHEAFLAILRHESVSGSSVLEDLSRDLTRPVVEVVAGFLAERQRAGEVRDDITPEEMILACLSMVLYPFIDAKMIEQVMPGLVGRDPDTLARRVHMITAMILAAIRPQAPR
jgi:TetR/AcrR family transcriptional regulator